MTDLNAAVRDRVRVIRSLESLLGQIASVATRMRSSLSRGGRVFWMGNGGSASHAQHMASELVGRFARERAGLASFALTADTAVLTAIANDYGYDQVFARQVKALCSDRDVVVGLTTSGTSRNVVEALRTGREIGAQTVVLTGSGGCALREVCDECLVVDADDAAMLQEAHLALVHLVCLVLDTEPMG